MARLSVFHDGFVRATRRWQSWATGGADLVDTLAEQSLVTVAEVDGMTRFRMLETVREFAADRLNAAGLPRRGAHRRQDAWAGDLVTRHRAPGCSDPARSRRSTCSAPRRTT